MSDNSKNNILQKIKQALGSPVPVPFPSLEATNFAGLYRPNNDDHAIVFAEQFAALQGQFLFCMHLQECVDQLLQLSEKRGIKKWYCADDSIRQALQKFGWNVEWHASLADCHASITGCEVLVARTGSMVLSSTASSGRSASVYAPIHICIAHSGQLVYDVSDALSFLEKKYGKQLPSQISFASGPSRTADIEKTLVTGVHGPKEVFCLLIEEA